MPSAQQAVVQRLDAEPVTGQQQASGCGVSQLANANMPTKRLQTGAALGGEQPATTPRCPRSSPWSRQCGAQMFVVVEFAVVGQHMRPEHHGLRPASVRS